jgi:hypothetical protein
MAIGYGIAQPKPEPSKRTKARAKREQRDRTAEIRAYVFGRERGLCRCCRVRRADSMHEIRPRSLGGKVSKANSIAACGSGTTGCHGFMQANEIAVLGSGNADHCLWFHPKSAAAASWLRITVDQAIESEPMRVYHA